MKNPALFHKTVSILVKAYQDGTLQHGKCTACAVGNLICHNLYQGQHEVWEKDFKADRPNWNDVFEFGQPINTCNFFGKAKEQINSTGYTLQQLVLIETSFENVENKYDGLYRSTEDGMFKGLMAVVDTLMQIHEATPLEVQQAKELFVKA